MSGRIKYHASQTDTLYWNLWLVKKKSLTKIFPDRDARNAVNLTSGKLRTSFTLGKYFLSDNIGFIYAKGYACYSDFYQFHTFITRQNCR